MRGQKEREHYAVGGTGKERASLSEKVPHEREKGWGEERSSDRELFVTLICIRGRRKVWR